MFFLQHEQIKLKSISRQFNYHLDYLVIAAPPSGYLKNIKKYLGITTLSRVFKGLCLKMDGIQRFLGILEQNFEIQGF